VTDADLGGFSQGTVNNAGSFAKSAGAGVAQVGGLWTIHNTGSLDVSSGELAFANSASGLLNDGAVTVTGSGTELRLGGGGGTGSVTVGADAALAISGSNVTVRYTLDGASAVLSNAGTVNISGYLDATGGASVTGAGAVNFSAGQIGGDSAVSLENLNWAGGTMVNTAGVVVPGGATATLSGSSAKRVGASGRFVVEGTAVVTGAGEIATTAPAANPSEISIAAGGLLDIQTNADLTDNSQPDRGGLLSNAGTFRKSAGAGTTLVEAAWSVDNSGLIDVDAGTLQIESPFAHTGPGAIDVAAGATIRFDGPVTGENNFAGNGAIFFNDDYSPGASPGVVSFGGNVSFGTGSHLTLEIGGAGQGEYDKLEIAGDLDFQGDLLLSFIELAPETGVFEPIAGDSFELITFGGALTPASAFDGAVLPPAPAMTEWSLSAQSGSLILSLNEVIPPLESGDYNGDNVVDAADYTVWRDNLGLGDGTPGSLAVTDGDGNGDGLVDVDDYTIWRNQYGIAMTVTPSLVRAAGAPEPSAALLLLWAASVGARRHRPGRRHR
ncbi:MAG: hypothetical protein KDA37_03550, partial [Planctomycetales bacterium]|nr:hypothetical protein [Planctomycetales bacterium]